MALEQGMGSCMIPVGENGYPCGKQIEEGEPIGSVLVGMGSRIGHKRCKDAFYARRAQEAKDAVAKNIKQAGPGGPVNLAGGEDAIMGSIPLVPPEKEPVEEPEEDVYQRPAPTGDDFVQARLSVEVPADDSGDHVPFVGVRNGQVVISDIRVTRDGNVHLTPEHAEDLAEDLQQKAARARRNA